MRQLQILSTTPHAVENTETTDSHVILFTKVVSIVGTHPVHQENRGNHKSLCDSDAFHGTSVSLHWWWHLFSCWWNHILDSVSSCEKSVSLYRWFGKFLRPFHWAWLQVLRKCRSCFRDNTSAQCILLQKTRHSLFLHHEFICARLVLHVCTDIFFFFLWEEARRASRRAFQEIFWTAANIWKMISLVCMIKAFVSLYL